RGGGEQLGDLWGGTQDMLEVIEDEQQIACCQILADAIQAQMCAEVTQAQGTSDGWNNVGRAESGTQVDKRNPMLERVDQTGGNCERQPGLARATSANQREQAGLRAEQQRTDVGHLVVASNQGCRLRRQTAGNERARHRYARNCLTP